MKKVEMKANQTKTANLQRMFRRWHAKCVFENDSELWVGFRDYGKEHMAKCSNCLISNGTDYGFESYSPFIKEAKS